MMKSDLADTTEDEDTYEIEKEDSTTPGTLLRINAF